MSTETHEISLVLKQLISIQEKLHNAIADKANRLLNIQEKVVLPANIAYKIQVGIVAYSTRCFIPTNVLIVYFARARAATQAAPAVSL